MTIFLAFITGLTAGGLSCLAVQGGLLASSLARQIELDMQARSTVASARGKFRPQIALPISLFLAAKLVAYTLLGGLLGAVGSVFQLSPLLRAGLMLAIGVFMVGNALRMLNVHPIFRYFVLEPPSAITRYIRRTSKNRNRDAWVAPLLLGALTVLIPCGIAQAEMALALGTGDPLQGATILFAFTLGTTPVFFTVAYFATRLGAAVEKYFTRLVAVVVLVLGLVSVDSALNLAGSPVSLSKAVSGLMPAPTAPLPTPVLGAIAPASAGGYIVNVGDSGYTPKILHLAAAKPVSLTWVTQGTHSCALSVVIPNLNYQKILPSKGQVALDIPAQPKGTVIEYSCSMGMYFGQLVFDLE